MKRIVALILAALMAMTMVFTMVSCGEKEEEKSEKESDKTPEEIAEIVSTYVEENKALVETENLKLEARESGIAFVYTFSEEDYIAESYDDIKDAINIYFGGAGDNVAVSIYEAIQNECPDIAAVEFEYCAPDGSIITSYFGTGRRR